jgi:hypothetical protein
MTQSMMVAATATLPWPASANLIRRGRLFLKHSGGKCSAESCIALFQMDEID